MKNLRKVYSDEQYDWFYTSDGYLYFAKRRTPETLAKYELRLANFVTFMLLSLAFVFAVIDATVIIYFLVGGLP